MRSVVSDSSRTELIVKRNISFAATALAGFIAITTAAEAREAGDWQIRAGVGVVDPKSDNGDVVSVDSGTSAVFNISYMLNESFAVEVLAALPFTHDIKLEAGGTTVGETKHLPPTVSVQYYFPTEGAFAPYAGVGLNYTLFFDQDTKGPLAGSDLELDASFGLAAQLGFDYDINETTFLNADVRWIDIETDAELDGAPLETVEIAPLVYSLTVGWRF